MTLHDKIRRCMFCEHKFTAGYCFMSQEIQENGDIAIRYCNDIEDCPIGKEPPNWFQRLFGGYK